MPDMSKPHPGLGRRAEAAAWLARLHGPQRAANVDRGFQRWLQAHPENVRAFALLTERLEAVERLRTRALPRAWRKAPRTTRVAWPLAAGVAAALGLVAAGAFAYLRYAGVGTAVGEQRTLTLEDGTRVYLNTSTRVRVHYDEGQRRIELVTGEALFDVAKESHRPFVVAAGDRDITALGTIFLVQREAQEISVTLVEGKVAVAANAGAERGVALAKLAVLAPGERLTISARKPPRVDHPALEKVAAWRQGQVALENVPLARAVAEMNRYSTVRLVVESPGAAAAPVGGFFRMGDSASFARAVADTYGLQVIERDDEIVLVGEPRVEVRPKTE